MAGKNTLNALDWMKGAFRALWRGGPQAIRIEAIARDLAVSKGSFYWHFKDLAALKKQMLEHWAELATFETIARIERDTGDAKKQLFALITLVTGDQHTDYGGPRVEAAIREWARFDKNVARVVLNVEQARLAFLVSLFKKCGKNLKTARQNARLLYGALIGLELLPGNLPAQRRIDLRNLVNQLLAGPAANL